MFDSRSLQQNVTENKTPRITQAQWQRAVNEMYYQCLRYTLRTENTGQFWQLDAMLCRAMYNSFGRALLVWEQAANLQGLCALWEISLPQSEMEVGW